MERNLHHEKGAAAIYIFKGLKMKNLKYRIHTSFGLDIKKTHAKNLDSRSRHLAVIVTDMRNVRHKTISFQLSITDLISFMCGLILFILYRNFLCRNFIFDNAFPTQNFRLRLYQEVLQTYAMCQTSGLLSLFSQTYTYFYLKHSFSVQG